MVKEYLPRRAQGQRRPPNERQAQLVRHVLQHRHNLQDLPQHLARQGFLPRQQPQPQPQQQAQVQQQQAPPDAGHRFQFQVGNQFAFEIAHIVLDGNAPAPPDAPVPALAPAPAVAVGAGVANGGVGAAVDNPADQQQPQQPAQGRRPLPVPPAGPAPQQQQPPPAPQPQDGQQQQQQQQPQRAEPGQEQAQVPAPVPVPRDVNANGLGFGAVAARAIRLTGASLGRLIGGALLMPSIARIMGSMLLHISHVVPLVRTIIAPLPPPLLALPAPAPSGPISTLVGLIRGARDLRPEVDPFGGAPQAGYGAALFRGFLATSNEWATSDPVWYVILRCVPPRWYDFLYTLLTMFFLPI